MIERITHQRLVHGRERATYPRFVGRSITHDHNFQYRMGAGPAGEATRSHPMTIEANKQHATTPVLGYGFAVVADPATGSVRQMAAGDAALVDIYGISVRFYPGQAMVPPSGIFGQQPLGTNIAPPTNLPIDILRMGYILVPVVGAPTKGSPVFVWVAASGGGHVQGGFEVAASAGNTVAIGSLKTTFNSGADPYGIAELAFNI